MNLGPNCYICRSLSVYIPAICLFQIYDSINNLKITKNKTNQANKNQLSKMLTSFVKYIWTDTCILKKDKETRTLTVFRIKGKKTQDDLVFQRFATDS